MSSTNSFQTPPIAQGWGGQYPVLPATVVSGFSYDLPNQILYTLYPAQTFDIFLTVNTSIPQQLVTSGVQNSPYVGQGYPTQDTIYKQQIAKVFPQCLLTENGAPLFSETSGDYLVLT